MNPDLEKLIRLQRAESDLHRVEAELGGIPAAYADRLKAACARYFGTAGPAFLRALVMKYDDARALTATIKAHLQLHAAALTPSNAPAEHQRAIKRFALLMVAGELAIKLGVLQDCEKEDIEHAVRVALRAWQIDGANVPDRLRGVLNVQAFLERCESRFQKLGDDSGQIPRERAGFVGWDEPARERAFLFTSDGFREACGGQDTRETARELYKLGLLFAREQAHHTEKRTIGSERYRVYVIRAALLDFDPGTIRDSGAIGAAGAVDGST